MIRTTFMKLGAIAALIAGAAAAQGGPPKAPVISSVKNAEWTALVKGSPLPALSSIDGDSGKGPHEAYLKPPAREAN